MKATLLLLVLGACITTPSDKPIPNVPHSTCPSPQLFEHAVCACEDLKTVGHLHVGEGPAGIGSVGVNGDTDLVAHADIAGTWIAWGGFNSVGVSIGDSLITPSDVHLVGDATITGDAVIGGDLDAVGALEVRGSLALNGDEHIVGDSRIARRAVYKTPAAPPCGCDDARFFDVAGAVALAKTKRGVASWSHSGNSEIHLTTGSYYVSDADLVGDSNIVIDGQVSVFVDGSLKTVGDSRWKLGANAQLDLFVAGDVEVVGNLHAGDETRPGAFRLYVGGDSDTTVDAIGDSSFYGSLYAPRAAVRFIGDALIVGSIFARTLKGVGNLSIEYGDPLTPASSCRLDGNPRAAAASGMMWTTGE